MTIRLRLLIGFFILILVFIGIFFINQRLSEEVLKNTTYLNNSEAVIRNSNALHKEMIEMQSGFRGFLLTNQEVFLEPYYEGIKSVPLLFQEQRSLITSETQKEKLDSIFTLHKNWIEYSDSLISTKKDTLPEASVRYQKLFETKLKMEVGKKLNDKIHDMFGYFDDHEYGLRQKRRLILQQSIKSTRSISVIITIVSIILVLISSVYFIRVVTQRISKMVNLAEKISKGDFITIKDYKNDELTRLVDSLNQMSETLSKNFTELKRKNNELDQFAYVVSHDLKAPLRGITNIILWIEEDHEKDITPGMHRNLSLIKGRTTRLENMINGLLEYARVGKVKKGNEKINLNILLKEIKDLVAPSNTLLIIKNNMPEILAERILLEQVFSNLISNAVKHNNVRQSEIVVECKENDNWYEFSVKDNGPGIEKDYFEKIFIIFQTLQERDAFETTGVGLAIVKKIIEDHKGSIFVESKLGEGTTFTFTWPKI